MTVFQINFQYDGLTKTEESSEWSRIKLIQQLLEHHLTITSRIYLFICVLQINLWCDRLTSNKISGAIVVNQQHFDFQCDELISAVMNCPNQVESSQLGDILKPPSQQPAEYIVNELLV